MPKCIVIADDLTGANATGVLLKKNGFDTLTLLRESMEKAAALEKPCIFAIGNAPTALLSLEQLMEEGKAAPALIIGVPVGFVNVVESKEVLFAACERYGVPAIAAMGRKGGSNVAAAICNALIYSAAEMLDPSARGWNG